ncbi:MAG TPA: pilus assembly protein TadG-related protein [Mycobacteriales bacterium]|nr:pilus assembly protein TadG-related protein [Mycobacteriales bacterium]
MTRATRPPGRSHPEESERGSLTVFTAVLALALLVMAGLVIDGTGKLRAAQQADGIAEEAARAGADTLNAAGLRAGQPVAVDPAAAITAAQAYLASAGVRGTVTAPAPAEIAVSVTISQPTAVLDLIGIDSWTVVGHATASLESGR